MLYTSNKYNKNKSIVEYLLMYNVINILLGKITRLQWYIQYNLNVEKQVNMCIGIHVCLKKSHLGGKVC